VQPEKNRINEQLQPTNGRETLRRSINNSKVRAKKYLDAFLDFK
jgi:hypothetical protein